MIKNLDKYKRLSPINLNDVKIIQKDRENGISTQTYGTKWFLLKKGNAIFKTFDDGYYKSTKKYRYINELLCYQLAKMVKVDCAVYEPAFKKENYELKTGVVSYKVNNIDEEICKVYNMNCKEITLNCIYQSIKNDAEENNLKLDKNIKFDLFKMLVFDTLCVQQDRHLNNIIVIDNLSTRTRKLSPLIDNEMAFGIKSLDELLDDEITPTKENIINKINRQSGSKYIKIAYYHDFEETIHDIVEYSKYNERYYNFLKYAIKNFDVNKAISILREEGVIVPALYEKYVLDLTDYVKNEFNSELNNKNEFNSESNKKYDNSEYSL